MRMQSRPFSSIMICKSSGNSDCISMDCTDFTTAGQLHSGLLHSGNLWFVPFTAVLYSTTSRVFLPLALFFYDTTLTFNREVMCFRSTICTWAMFLFLANKGISLTLYVMEVMDFASFPSDKVRTLSHDMSSDHTNMQIGCRGLRHAGPDVNNCVFTLNLCSCSVFANTAVAVEVLQMVPWAGTVHHPRLSCIV